jgi:hypothetical protein
MNRWQLDKHLDWIEKELPKLETFPIPDRTAMAKYGHRLHDFSARFEKAVALVSKGVATPEQLERYLLLLGRALPLPQRAMDRIVETGQVLMDQATKQPEGPSR